MEIRFRDRICNIELSRYVNNVPAILLFNENGEPFIKATVNISFFNLGDESVLIDNHGENEGILECLVTAGIIQDTGKELWTGDVKLNICRLVIPIPKQ
jgi:hypothetical protein